MVGSRAPVTKFVCIYFKIVHVNFCANDLKSVIVRVLHVAANYYEARRLHGRLGGFTRSEIHINISQTRLQCIQVRVRTEPHMDLHRAISNFKRGRQFYNNIYTTIDSIII
jgi:hypothetical protein